MLTTTTILVSYQTKNAAGPPMATSTAATKTTKNKHKKNDEGSSGFKPLTSTSNANPPPEVVRPTTHQPNPLIGREKTVKVLVILFDDTNQTTDHRHQKLKSLLRPAGEHQEKESQSQK